MSEPWAELAAALAVAAGRLADGLPAVARVVADVERDWLDERGREWADRASLVRAALSREFDAVLDHARVVGAALDGQPADGQAPRSVVSGAARPPKGGSRPDEGPRLGGTDADRTDDVRGVRIAQLGADGAEPG